jgi:sialic acid synthase SpsE
MIYAIHNVEKALGNGQKLPSAKEMEVAKVARRSLVASRDLLAGELLEAGTVAIRRPGTGLPPAQLPSVLGLRTRLAIPKGTLLAMDMLETP